MAQKNKLRKLLTKNLVDVGQALVALNVPGKVITDDLSAAWTELGEGNILRIQTAGDAYIAFNDIDGTTTTVGVATSPGLKLVGAGVHYVVCQCDWVRMSVAATRVELLDSFRQILLRKTKDYPYINTVIELMGEDRLGNMLEESLQKMARTNPNSSLTWWANKLNAVEAPMIYDAVSHHASQYKAALKAGDEKTADLHMHQLHKTMFLLNKLTRDGSKDAYEKHVKSGPDGQPLLSFDAPPTSHWERGEKGNQKRESGGLLHWRSGIARKPGFSYDYLRRSPSHSEENYNRANKDAKEKGHDYSKSYPLEEIKINGKHIHVDDDAKFEGEFSTHPFDEHPIFDVLPVSSNGHTGEHKGNFIQKYLNFMTGDSFNNWFKGYQDNKEHHDSRGAEKSDSVHSHINEKMEEPSFESLDFDDELANITGKKSETPAPAPAEAPSTITDLDEISSLLDSHISSASAPKPEAPKPVDLDKELANIKNIGKD
jgi:hypothetical protein